MSTVTLNQKDRSYGARLMKNIRQHWIIYFMALLVLIYYIIFCYLPMYGVLFAFQDYNIRKGFWGSKWVQFKHFKSFFSSYYFLPLLRNTFLISFYDLIFGFPAPIILALLMNEIKSSKYKKFVQTVSYVPHFISTVVICGILSIFCASNGLFNDIIVTLGGSRSDLLGHPELFRTIYVSSGIWQEVGFGSIIYLAALAAVDPELYDAAYIDGAGKLQQIWHITLPGIMPTIAILLILRVGSLMSVGYEKIILLYNTITYDTADVISTFVYRRGLMDGNYSYSTAVGLFNSVINFVLLLGTNLLMKKISETSLW